MLQKGGSPGGASRVPTADGLARFGPYVEDGKGSRGPMSWARVLYDNEHDSIVAHGG